MKPPKKFQKGIMSSNISPPSYRERFFTYILHIVSCVRPSMRKLVASVSSIVVSFIDLILTRKA